MDAVLTVVGLEAPQVRTLESSSDAVNKNELSAKTASTTELTTKTLCVDSVCVDSEDLRSLLKLRDALGETTSSTDLVEGIEEELVEAEADEAPDDLGDEPSATQDVPLA